MRKQIVTTFAAAALVLAVTSVRATTQLGQPYDPPGQNYTITAQQAINASGGNGTSLANTQVNIGFEFSDGIGVTYDQNNQGKSFGIGLYQDAAHATQSSGLKITFDSLTAANTVVIKLADFDIKASDVQSGHVTGFNPAKVEPGIILYGANGAQVANFDPATIFKSMTPSSGAAGSEDYWNVSFAALLANAGVSNQGITGFLLYADQNHGENSNSDPYFLVNAAGTTLVPEMSSLFPLVGLAVAVAATHALRRRRLARTTV